VDDRFRLSQGLPRRFGRAYWPAHHRRTATTLAELAKQYNPVLRAWWNYFGEFYPSAMHSFAMYLDGKLMQWARRKYKTLERREQASVQWLIKMKNIFPRLFFYWSVTGYSVG
jgi:RNA-directed DNA polymerase